MDGIPITNIFPISTSSLKTLLSERKDFDFSEIYKERNIAQELTEFYRIKEQEWIKLVGKQRWHTLNEEKRDFLIKTAGIIDLGEGINIKDGYKYYE